MAPRVNIRQREKILELLTAGVPKAEVADRVGVTKGQVAAISAHVTMGSYERAASPRSSSSTAKPLSGDVPVAVPAAAHLLPPDQQPGARTAIPLGTVVGSDFRAWWFPEPSSGAPNPHMVICGASGFGKTYLLMSLIAELAQHGLPALVFDFGQGFSESELPPEVSSHVPFQQIDVNRRGVAVNPLALFESDVRGPVNAAQRVADTFHRVYPRLGIQQHAQIRDAVLDCFDDVGIRREEPLTWSQPAPAFSRLRTALETRAEDPRNPGRRAASMAASHVSTLFVFEVFTRRGTALDWSAFLGESVPWIIQLAGLEHSVASATAEFLLWNFLGFIEARGPGRLRSYVVLDEAHRLACGHASPIERLLREGRKFGVGLLLASQQPQDFDELVFNNSATQVVFQVDDPTGRLARRLRRKASNKDTDDVAKPIGYSRRGRAYVVSHGVGVSVDILPINCRVAKW
jgi:hypothetical protein